MMHQALVPPASLKGHTKKEIGQWRMEFDVLAALNRLGHEVIPLGVEDELGPVRRAIREHSPHLGRGRLVGADEGALHGLQPAWAAAGR